MRVHTYICVCMHVFVCVCALMRKCVLVFRSSLPGHSGALDQEGDCGRRSLNQPARAHPVSHCLHVHTYMHTHIRKLCIYIRTWLIDTITCEPPCTNLQ